MEAPIDVLKKIDILSSFTHEELLIIYSLMKSVEIEKGKILFHEGDAGEEMYIVVSGKVSISVKIPDGGEFEIAEIAEGNFFGEMSIFEHVPRSATCYTKEDTTLLSLNGGEFYNFIQDHPSTTIKIMHRMLNITSQRLQNTGEFLSDMVTWGENARKRAITDELTELYNRRFLDDALEDRFTEAKLNRRPLSLVMVDLDYFGELNKEYGQEVGDKVILSVVPVFQSVFGEGDILARYGGDEFTFILSDTEAAKALNLCTKVVRELRKIKLLENMDGNIKQITSSIGIASFPAHADTLETLKERTDQALYQAKERGRNRAALYSSQVVDARRVWNCEL